MHIYKSISHLSYPCSHYILSNITWRSYPSVARDVWPALGPGAVRLERAALELRLWLRVEQPSLEPGAVRLERVALGLRLWLGVELPSVEPGAVRLERVALGLRLHVASGGAAVCGTWWGSVGTGGLGTCPVSLWWVSLRTACCGTGSGGSPYIRTSKTIAVAWFRLERPVLDSVGTAGFGTSRETAGCERCCASPGTTGWVMFCVSAQAECGVAGNWDSQNRGSYFHGQGRLCLLLLQAFQACNHLICGLSYICSVSTGYVGVCGTCG